MRRQCDPSRVIVAIGLFTAIAWLTATFWPNGAIYGVQAQSPASPSPASSPGVALIGGTPTVTTISPRPLRHADGGVTPTPVVAVRNAVAPRLDAQPPPHPGAPPSTIVPQPIAGHHGDGTLTDTRPNPKPSAHPITQPPGCTGYGDGAYDRNGISVDVWAPGIRVACGYPGYENGDNPMPLGTPFPPPRPFRSIDPMEPVFGFKVFYLNAGSLTPCNQLRIIFHQGDSPGGRAVRFHSMQYSIAHCDSNGNYLGYTDVAAFADTGGVMDVNPMMPNGDNGTRPAKLVPSLADVSPPLQQVFEVWYVDFLIHGPGFGNTPIVTVRPGFDIHNVSVYYTPGDFTTLNYTCSVPGLGGGMPGDVTCQYDGSKRGLSHPTVVIANQNGVADFCTDLYGGNPTTSCNTGTPLHQHVFNGAPLTRMTCTADGGVGTPPDCYPEFVHGPNSPGANRSSTPYESPGPATYAAPGLAYPN